MSSFSSFPSSSTQPSSDSILAPEERRDKNQLLENVACRHNQEITKMDFMSYSTKTPHTTALLQHIIYSSFSSDFFVCVCSLHFRRKSKTFFMSFFIIMFSFHSFHSLRFYVSTCNKNGLHAMILNNIILIINKEIKRKENTHVL